jgi:hypothetical protein
MCRFLKGTDESSVGQLMTTKGVRTQGASDFKVLESKRTMNMFIFVVQKSDRRLWRFGRLNGQRIITIHFLIRK